MSYKYIPQLDNENFIFPNYDLAEYDVEILHEINDNSVEGTVSSFSATSISSSSITIQYSWTWLKNNGQVYISPSNLIHLVSVHCLTNTQTYYKPWRLVDLRTDPATGFSTYSSTTTFTITPSQMGVSSFTSGTYYFEIRFIGLKSIYPVCQTLSITIP
jgi:hypothetical protein